MAAEDGERQVSSELTISLDVNAIVFAIIGIVGNLLSVVSLLYNRALRTKPATVLVLSLCASDLLFCALLLPLKAIHLFMGSWPFGEGSCVIYLYLCNCAIFVSLTSISAITVNRYVRIVHSPDAYARLYTRGRLCAMLALMWSFGPLLLLLPRTGRAWEIIVSGTNTGMCFRTVARAGSVGYTLFLLLGCTLPCAAIIVFCYYKIYRTVRRSKAALQAHRQQQPRPAMSELRSSLAPPPTGAATPGSRSTDQGSSRLTRTIFLIIVCFTLCFAPYILIRLIDPQARRWPALYLVTSVPIWFSSMVNPAIYAASNAQYRQAFLHLIRALRGRVGLSTGASPVS